MKDEKIDFFDQLFSKALEESIDAELERLPSDKELKILFPIPKKHVKQALRRLKAKKYRRPLALVYFQRVGVIFLAVSTILFGVLLFDDSVRASVSKAIINIREQFFEISFIDEDSNKNETVDVNSLKIGYIPEGFELKKKTVFDGYQEFHYSDEKDNPIFIKMTNSKNKNMIDNENISIEYMEINGYEACIVSSLDSVSTVLIMGNGSIQIDISAGLEKEEVIKIAKNIK